MTQKKTHLFTQNEYKYYNKNMVFFIISAPIHQFVQYYTVSAQPYDEI